VRYERHRIYFFFTKSNQTLIALSTIINRFESCFKSETFNNSSKKMHVLLHDNARSPVAKVVKVILSAF